MSALRFALALMRRRAARTGRPAPAAHSLARAPQRGVGAAAWHLHVRRSLLRVEPRLSLAVSMVAAPPAVTPPTATAVESPAAERTREVLAHFRRHDRTHERRAIELRVVCATERLTQRCITRAVRIEAERAPAAAATAAPAGVVMTTPAVDLRLPARPAAVERAQEPPPEVRSAVAALGAPEPVRADPAPVVAAPDVERLADSVLDVIDRRVVAHRERLGRP